MTQPPQWQAPGAGASGSTPQDPTQGGQPPFPPGRYGAAPGQYGTPPGQQPGQDGPPPGQYGTPPGAPGAQPGQYGYGTGHQPPWQTLPPEQLARMHQPGIVPLRPLTVGDIFGGALQTIRRNPRATMGMALVVSLIFLVPSLLISLGLMRFLDLAAEDEAGLSSLAMTLISGLASLTLTGLLVHVVGEAVLGERATPGQAWQAVKGRIPALIGLTLLMMVVGTVLALGVILLVALVVWGLAQAGEVVAVVGGLFLGLGAFVLIAWLVTRLSLGSPAVVLERIGPWKGLVRSWRLTSGAQSWRILAISLLAGLLGVIFTYIVVLPLGIVGGLLLAGMGLDGGDGNTAMVLFNHVFQVVTSVVAAPFTAGVTALLYLDQRIRREGLDVSLTQTAQARAAARNV